MSPVKPCRADGFDHEWQRLSFAAALIRPE
jgi:hypothetical protein